MRRGRPPAQVASILRRMAKDMERDIRTAEERNLRTALSIALSLSSGPYSTAQLRAMGHPYRRGGPGLGDVARLNRQTGRFYRGWRLAQPALRGGALVGALVNRTPYARFFDTGTRRMMARPIRRRIEEHLARVRDRRLRTAAGRALEV